MGTAAPTRFGELLRRHRLAAGLGQEALAALAALVLVATPPLPAALPSSAGNGGAADSVAIAGALGRASGFGPWD